MIYTTRHLRCGHVPDFDQVLVDEIGVEKYIRDNMNRKIMCDKCKRMKQVTELEIRVL